MNSKMLIIKFKSFVNVQVASCRYNFYSYEMNVRVPWKKRVIQLVIKKKVTKWIYFEYKFTDCFVLRNPSLFHLIAIHFNCLFVSNGNLFGWFITWFERHYELCSKKKSKESKRLFISVYCLNLYTCVLPLLR